MTYPDHVRRQARALMFSGYSAERVHKELRELYGPDEKIPEPWTIIGWRREDGEIREEEARLVEENERRLSLRFDAFIDRKLDALEDNLDKVRVTELIMGAGVYRDKQFKREDLKRVPSTAVNEILAAVAARVLEMRGQQLLLPAASDVLPAEAPADGD